MNPTLAGRFIMSMSIKCFQHLKKVCSLKEKFNSRSSLNSPFAYQTSLFHIRDNIKLDYRLIPVQFITDYKL